MAQITQSFLENALGEEIDSFEVNSGSNLGDGFTSLLYTVDVKLKKCSQNLHLILKCFPTHPMRQAALSRMNMFEKELRVYDTLIPQITRVQDDSSSSEGLVEIPIPKFYYGRAIDYTKLGEGESTVCVDPLENCILLEDVRKSRGFKLANRRTGFDLDHSKLVMVAYAKLHGLSWAYKSKQNLPRLTTQFPFITQGHFEHMSRGGFDKLFDGCLASVQTAIKDEVKDEIEQKILLEAVTKARSKGNDIMHLYIGNPNSLDDTTLNKDNCLRVPGEVKENEDCWGVALHVDSRLDNMMFRYDEDGKPLEVLLLDFQTVKEGDLMADISYSLFTSTNPDPWMNHSDQLLSLYIETFLGICKKLRVAPPGDFNIEELKRRFHRGKIFGLMVAIMCFPLLFKDPENAVDLDKVSKDVTREKFVEELAKMTGGMSGNERFKIVVVEILRKLYTQGVI